MSAMRPSVTSSLRLASTAPHRVRRRRGPSGQGMTEYIVIVALVAVASIGLLTRFGQNVRQILGASTTALTGKSVGTSGVMPATVTDKNLKNFAKSNKETGE